MALKKEITIYDIADDLNTSASTVSRALNDNPLISIEMRRRIKEHAQMLGFRSNKFAKDLRNKKTNTIGVIVPHIESYFVSSAIGGIERVLNTNNYNLIISQSFESSIKEIKNARTMYANHVDGLILSLAGDTTDLAHILPFAKMGIPIVMFDRVLPEFECAQVVINNFEAAYKITSHLISQNCKNIIHIAGNLNSTVYSERLRGYKAAIEDNKLEYFPQNVISADLIPRAGELVAEDILNNTRKADGIFAANDSSAIACMSVLMDAGIRIPEDICIAGFNNDRITKYIKPGLTTVNYPGSKIGEQTAHILLKILTEGLSGNKKEVYTVSSEIIIRESSQRIKI